MRLRAPSVSRSELSARQRRDIVDISVEVAMGDMLIRGIGPDLKRRLEESARRNGRSLSDEAIALMQRGFSVQSGRLEKAGDRLYGLVGDVRFSDEEMKAIEDLRRETDRAPPDFM